MSRTFAQLRALTMQQTGLTYVTGTADSSGSTTNILRADELTRYDDRRLIGHHVLLTSGSPTFNELYVKDSFQLNGDLLFRPEIAAAPDSLTFELMPFSGTDFLRALQDSILHLYDLGYLQRTFWMYLMGGSPIYNADWAYWTSATAVDGWTATGTTLAKELASGNLAMGETTVSLTSAAGNLALDAQYQRYLNDYKGSSVTMYCWVKATDATNARIAINNGSDNFSPYHSGDGDWELLHFNLSTDKSDTALQPKLVTATTTTAQFGMPWFEGLDGVPTIYPFAHQVMPDGPTTIQIAHRGHEENEFGTGRGSGDLRQINRGRALMNAQLRKHHDENTTTQVGVLDFTELRTRPINGQLLWLRGDGPLTVPTSVLSTDNLEVTQSESLLLATSAAIRLLEKAASGAPSATRRTYGQRILELQTQLSTLIGGAGEARNVAAYGLGW